MLKYPLTRRHIHLFVRALNNVFGANWVFGLCPIAGGIEVLDWPGKELGMAKHLQFKGKVHWPTINPNSLNEWRLSEQIVVEGESFDTFLCAIGGAPCWTIEELEKWNRAFSVFDVMVRQKSMYPRSKYVSFEKKTTKKEKEEEEDEVSLTPVKKRQFSVRSDREKLQHKRIRVRIV